MSTRSRALFAALFAGATTVHGAEVHYREAHSGTVNITIELGGIDFGLPALNTCAVGKDYGFKMDVNLRIQVEGVKDEK